MRFFGAPHFGPFSINVPFLTDLYDAVFYFWAHFINIVSLTWLQCWLSFMALKFSLLNILGFNQNYLYKAFNDSTSLTSQKRTLPSAFKNLSLSPVVFYDNNALNLIYHLSKVTKSLSYLKPQNFMQQVLASKRSRLLSDIHDLLPESTTPWDAADVKFSFKEFANYVTVYGLENNNDLSWSNFLKPSVLNVSNLSSPKFITLNLSSLQTLNNTRFSPALNNLNVYSNLSQFKQDRWLMKNSILNNSSVVDLNAFTQAKKLVGVNLLDSANTSSNIWNSAKMTQLSKTSELQQLSLLKNFIGLNGNTKLTNELKSVNEFASGLDGFNWFESGSLWTSKKYFFTNQLKSQTVLLSTSKNPVNLSSPTNNSYTFQSVGNLHSTNLQFRLDELNNAVYAHTFFKYETFNGGLINSNARALMLANTNLDLLEAANLDVTDTLTSPIIEKNANASNYTSGDSCLKDSTIFYTKKHFINVIY